MPRPTPNFSALRGAAQHRREMPARFAETGPNGPAEKAPVNAAVAGCAAKVSIATALLH